MASRMGREARLTSDEMSVPTKTNTLAMMAALASVWREDSAIECESAESGAIYITPLPPNRRYRQMVIA